jgi:uncharacterized protein (TIGR03083 family)
VLSHLGSGAEIFALMLQASRTGASAPGIEQLHPIWDVWNAKSPGAMRDDALKSDEALVDRLEGLSADEAAALQFSMGPFELDLAGFARMRLAEHAVHVWDVAVTFDADSEVADEAVALLLPGLGQLAGRSGKPAETPYRVLLTTSDGRGAWTVSTGESASFAPAQAGDAAYDGEIVLPSAALLRLVYGRLDVDHAPAGITETGERGLFDLRQVFPGF